MFDTNKVANNIKNARTKKNMTQMNLADEMGVSYQAVSNWERGNSMPDISKLPELCKILDLSFEELVGEKSEQTDITERMMKDENADVSLEEIAQVVPLVKPEKLEVKVKEAINNEEKISFSTLIGLAPFMDKDRLGEMAEELADIDLKKLTALAPFLNRKTLDNIVERQIKDESLDTDHVVAIAPFLDRETIQKIVEYLTAHGHSNKIIAIAPFMGREMFPRSLQEINLGFENDRFSVTINCPCANGNDSDEEELDDLDEDEVAERAFAALEKGNDVEEYLDFMAEDDVDDLAVKALEAGRNTEAFLDYMSEDGVEALANKAFELGKPVEDYLDYMDEDAIKRLLLKSINK